MNKFNLPDRSEKRFYVYIYRDLDGTSIYVGKGKGSRWRDHYKANTALGHKLRKVEKKYNKSLFPEIVFAIDENHAFFLEECLIGIFGRKDMKTGTLFNFTNGGDGPSGVVPSKETRIKMGNSRRGKTHTEETKRQMALTKIGPLNPNYGKKLSKETCLKMSLNRSGMDNGKFGGRNVFVLGEGKFVDMKVNERFCFNPSVAFKESKNIKPFLTYINIRVPDPTYQCPYCPIKTTRGNFLRWHSDNCKSNPAKK